MKKALRRIITRTLWTLTLLYLGVIALLHVPAFQRFTADVVAEALADKLATRVEVGRIDLGFLNRIIIDDVLIYDHQHAAMLRASRLSARVDVMPLMEGRVRISSVQLFGLQANLYKQTARGETNFQFMVDSLKSKSQEPSAPLDLQIQSIILRNGQVEWNERYLPPTPRRLNVHHLKVSNVSTHIALYTLTDDSLSVKVKRLSLREQSGLDLRALTLAVTAGKSGATVRDLTFSLPQSQLQVPLVQADYRLKKGALDPQSLRYRLQVSNSTVSLTDFAFAEPLLRGFDEQLSLSLDAEGSASRVRLRQLSLHNADRSTLLSLAATASGFDKQLAWTANVKRLKVSNGFFRQLSGVLAQHGVRVPEQVARLGNIDFHGKGRGAGSNVALDGRLDSEAGEATVSGWLKGNQYDVKVQTPAFDLGRVLDNDKLGIVACDLSSHGRLGNARQLDVSARGSVSRFFYNGYDYRNISLDGSFRNDTFEGTLAIDDPNGRASLQGRVGQILAYLQDRTTPLDIDLQSDVRTLNLQRLKLTDALGDYTLSNIQIEVKQNPLFSSASLRSDFGDASLQGQYSFETLAQSFTRVLYSKLPALATSMPTTYAPARNRFTYALHLRDASPLKQFLGVPLVASQPISLEGAVDEPTHALSLALSAPSVNYSGTRIDDISLSLQSDADSLQAHLQGARISDSGTPFSVDADLTALDDHVFLRSRWNAHAASPTYGTVNATAQLFREGGAVGAHVRFAPSEAVFDTVRLAVQPSELTYAKNRLTINHFEVSNGSQHVTVNGTTTGSDEDSLKVELQNINVAYILDLVDFHSVDFAGTASGRASVKSLFHKPAATAHLDVEHFTFNDGRMGTLHANASYDGERINIDAVADDGPEAQTLIGGYVSIKDNYIDLPIRAQGTRLEFLESFCGAFMDNIDGHAVGLVRVFGDLRDVNLEGDLKASGMVNVTPLRTAYELRDCAVHIIPDHIIFERDTVYDQHEGIGIVTGELRHESLRHLTYNINVEAQNLLAYDHKTYGSNTFYGTVFATGNCAIRGRSGELVMDVNATPERGSFIEYNATDEASLAGTDFIKWIERKPELSGRSDLSDQSDSSDKSDLSDQSEKPALPDIPSDMRINFLVNTNPNFTLRVLMDKASGDYIALNGDGVIRASYFNKGAFQMFGNYNVSHGIYKLTIQNVIKKDFVFQPGSTISFGGDPYNAALNLKGVYTVNGASLSDLQLGNSFTRNNVRVNCLMDIKGTPESPTVDFGLELPTLSSDAQAMVRSVINSEEDMNQQVLYLLAVGRFYPQGQNNATTQDGTQQNQTSLAMQSLLSGTISQQINTVLSNVIKNNDWSFGANISTGDEGFANAEYEGLLSGRMFNNRLLFNGQFGYRDNVTTNTSSFIGDFDLRYLLTPSGSFAVRVYNQTNDRYFTRNSLNTQGLGVILKKDFTSLKDLFTWRKKSRAEAKENKQKKK